MSQYPQGQQRSAARGQRGRVCLRDYWAVPAQVLTVEDDQATAEMIGIVLATHRVHSAWVGSGERAIAEFQRLRPQLVLLDLVLPDIDGIAVCKAIRAVSATPIVIVSASRDPEMIAAATAAGADDYLLKPFTVQQLVTRVDAHLPSSAAPTPITVPAAPVEAASATPPAPAPPADGTYVGA